MSAPVITGLDHLVLTVLDVARSVAFYTSVLGFEVQRFGEAGERVALVFGEQKVNLHPAVAPFVPHAANPVPGCADLCFLTDSPLETAMAHVRDCGVDILEGPVRRTGACGPLLSFYFRDPDDNLIEVSTAL